ncbi:MAG: CoA-transferase subunit beta [Promethearchaeota archaeon]
MSKYTSTEMMAVCGAHAVHDGERVFAGTGLPVLGAMLAKVTHAPNAIIIYEGGNVDCQNKDLALSVADSRLCYRAAASIGLIETLGYLMMGGRVDVGFLGAAQIDEYGNINTSYIGEFEAPKVRLPGSGGGNDIASSAGRIILMFTHDTRKFVKKLDYVTSPGHLSGPGSREKLGLIGGGPALVVTDKCQMDFDKKTKRIQLKSVHPGVTVDWVKENVMFDLIVPKRVPTTPEPTELELEKLRGLDPQRIYLGKGQK